MPSSCSRRPRRTSRIRRSRSCSSRPSSSRRSGRCWRRVARARPRSPRSGPPIWRSSKASRSAASSSRPTARASSAAAVACGRRSAVLDGRPAVEHASARCSTRSSACAVACGSNPGMTVRVAFWTHGRRFVAGGDARARRQAPRGGRLRARRSPWPGRRRRCSCATSASTADEAHLFQRLANRVLYSRSDAAPVVRRAEPLPGRTADALWRTASPATCRSCWCDRRRRGPRDLVRQLLRAHKYWRMKQLAVDLVILNERTPPTRRSCRRARGARAGDASTPLGAGDGDSAALRAAQRLVPPRRDVAAPRRARSC
jgi:cyclic beta-1,2-glucan synthetase